MSQADNSTITPASIDANQAARIHTILAALRFDDLLMEVDRADFDRISDGLLVAAQLVDRLAAAGRNDRALASAQDDLGKAQGAAASTARVVVTTLGHVVDRAHGAAQAINTVMRRTDRRGDPVFAAIERHRKVNAEHVRFFSRTGEFGRLEAEFTVNGQLDLEALERDPRHSPLQAEELELGEIVQQAADELVRTVPTTLPGLAALLTYARNEVDYGLIDAENMDAFLITIERAVRRVGGLAVSH